MKLHLDSPSDDFVIERHGGGSIRINGVEYQQGVVLTPRGIADIAVSESDLVACLSAVIDLPRTDIYLLGLGEESPPYRMEWLAPFAQVGASLEIMSLPAACRTYNILRGDGREVTAILVIRE